MTVQELNGMLRQMGESLVQVIRTGVCFYRLGLESTKVAADANLKDCVVAELKFVAELLERAQKAVLTELDAAAIVVFMHMYPPQLVYAPLAVCLRQELVA
ncbi:MAG TPA: hypothetical protein PLP17_11410 [Oligoflexia bacterium]|nr:hypothetical protein [Oligoflexia bacterium]